MTATAEPIARVDRLRSLIAAGHFDSSIRMAWRAVEDTLEIAGAWNGLNSIEVSQIEPAIYNRLAAIETPNAPHACGGFAIDFPGIVPKRIGDQVTTALISASFGVVKIDWDWKSLAHQHNRQHHAPCRAWQSSRGAGPCDPDIFSVPR